MSTPPPLPASIALFLARARDRIARRRREAADADLAVAAILARERDPLHDVAGFVRFLRECFGPLRFSVSETKAASGASDLPALRFQTLLEQLRHSPSPIPEDRAVRFARIADDLLSRTDPFERADWAADVGVHARIASSFGQKGRLLTTIVRAMRSERAIEIGTAYGMSALFLAAAMGPQGRVVTAERSEPQVGIAKEILHRENREAVTVLGGISTDLVAAARDQLGDADLLFHDGEHSREAYVEDFASFEPVLASGAVVLYDDIRWSVDRRIAAETHAGWLEVVAHPRVRCAAEIDRQFGLALLH